MGFLSNHDRAEHSILVALIILSQCFILFLVLEGFVHLRGKSENGKTTNYFQIQLRTDKNESANSLAPEQTSTQNAVLHQNPKLPSDPMLANSSEGTPSRDDKAAPLNSQSNIPDPARFAFGSPQVVANNETPLIGKPRGFSGRPSQNTPLSQNNPNAGYISHQQQTQHTEQEQENLRIAQAQAQLINLLANLPPDKIYQCKKAARQAVICQPADNLAAYLENLLIGILPAEQCTQATLSRSQGLTNTACQ
jgi:hypothetical protein